MPAPTQNPFVATGTLTTDTTFTGIWKRMLVKNFDTAQAFGLSINGAPAYTMEALTRHGDTYQDGGIRTVTLVHQGGSPTYEVILHN